MLTAGGVDQTARIWDLEGNELQHMVHMSPTNVAAFSPDNSIVAVGCGDGSTWIWEAATGRMLAQLPGHSAGVIAAEFEPDGRSLATACADGNVRVRYTLANDVLAKVEQKCTREFTHAEIREYSALLGHKYDGLLSAYEYVEPWLSELSVEDIRTKARNDGSLKEEVRGAALNVLNRTCDEPTNLRRRAWEVVRQAGRTAEEYVSALRWARTVDDLEHDSLSSRVVLGVAQHRAGLEDAALNTLQAVGSNIDDASPWTRLTCIGALALVEHALGQDEKARLALARFDQLSSAPGLEAPVPFRYRVFLTEVRALEREIGPGNGPR